MALWECPGSELCTKRKKYPGPDIRLKELTRRLASMHYPHGAEAGPDRAGG